MRWSFLDGEHQRVDKSGDEGTGRAHFHDDYGRPIHHGVTFFGEFETDGFGAGECDVAEFNGLTADNLVVVRAQERPKHVVVHGAW